MHVYGACGEIPSAHLVRERAGDALAHRLEPLRDRRVGLAEDLEVDRPAQPEIGAGRRCGAAEAAVADRRDPRAQAVERPQARDRLHVLELDPRLPLDVQSDPIGEAEPVAEPYVDVVLEVRVRVDETGEDHRLLVVDGVSELLARPDGRDRAGQVVDPDGTVADRRSLDGHHPVGGDDRHRPAST